MPVQAKIAADLHVAQSLVSRAQNGKLKRVTTKVEALLEYARSRASKAELAAAAAKAIDDEKAGLLDTSVLVIDNQGGNLTREGQRRRQASSAEAYRREALVGVKAYLKDGYDPRLIVEQLAVLRRAQHVRRPALSVKLP